MTLTFTFADADWLRVTTAFAARFPVPAGKGAPILTPAALTQQRIQTWILDQVQDHETTQVKAAVVATDLPIAVSTK